MREKKRVLICHYRSGRTDGVSLEMAKRREILEKNGFEVAYLAGPGSTGAEYVIPSLDFDDPAVRRVTENAFSALTDFSCEEELLCEIEAIAAMVQAEASSVIAEFDPDFLMVHNILSHGRHIPAAKGFADLIDRLGIRTLATHHDFYWERPHMSRPSGPLVKRFLGETVPPILPSLIHGVINTLSRECLKRRRGIDSEVFPDTLDFDQSPWDVDGFNSTLMDDLGIDSSDIVVVQATRIVKRKGIELIGPVIESLNRRVLPRLPGRRLYNGKRVRKESRFVLVLAGYAESEALGYRDDLERQLRHLGVPHVFASNRLAACRGESAGIKTYSLFDLYAHADLVTYPSLFEGWGNQFLEAVYAKKPVLYFEYPVFLSDIAPLGYRGISLGHRVVSGGWDGFDSLPVGVVERVCYETERWLLSQDTPALLDSNFEIARMNNSYSVLESRLLKAVLA